MESPEIREREVRVSKVFYAQLAELLLPDERVVDHRNQCLFLVTPYGKRLFFVPSDEKPETGELK